MASSVQRLLLHDPIIRLDAGEEGVHQARVATRRLRSDLRTFRPLLDADRVGPIRDELGWLGGLLGWVRDADVLGGRLAEAVDRLDEGDRDGGRLLLARLDEQRGPRLAELHEALDSDRYLGLVEALVDLALNPPLSTEAAEPARTVLPGLADRPWEHLVRNIGGLAKHPSVEELHRVRILAKRARYAAEASSKVIPAAGRHAERDRRSSRGSSVTFRMPWSGSSGSATLSRMGPVGTEAFAAGLLVSGERATASRHRGRWRQAWEAADRKKLRSWLAP